MWTMDIQEIIVWLALAFCGGVFGASVGALCAFVFCGVGAVLSSTLMLAGHAETAGWVDAWVTWGPLVGPQTSLVAGCWAAVYAQHHAGFANGRDLCKPLVTLGRLDVLLVGGVGGVVGALCTWLFWMLPSYSVQGTAMASCNSVACGVAVASVIGRLVCGRSGLFGKVPEGVNRFAGNASFCWVPWQHGIGHIVLLAVAIGLPTAFMTFANPASHLMVFGLMTVLYLFMTLGMGVIAAHHFGICAFFATAATGNILWGVAFALMVGFFTEFFAFLFTAYGDSHIDPPTLGITLCGFLQPLLLWSGVMPFKPLKAAAQAADLKSIAAMVTPGGDLSGVIALVLVLILLPWGLWMLRGGRTRTC